MKVLMVCFAKSAENFTCISTALCKMYRSGSEQNTYHKDHEGTSGSTNVIPCATDGDRPGRESENDDGEDDDGNFDVKEEDGLRRNASGGQSTCLCHFVCGDVGLSN